MPSILTHYGFNKELFDNNIKFLKDNEDIYLVGAQGPDPFFFYGIIPFLKEKNSKAVREFGKFIHKTDPKEQFEFFFEYADKSKNKDVLYAYILGAGLHYILDRKIHPYVFYKTGFSDDKKMKVKYFADHTLFETHLDVLLMNNRYQKYKVQNVESIKCKDNKVEDVSEMYGSLAKNILKVDDLDDESFENSYEHMCVIEKILYSKTGVKKWFAKVFAKNTPFNTMMQPLTVSDDTKIDYLNLNKKEWKDPSTGVVYKKDFYELLDEAKEESVLWMKLVDERYNGKKINLENFTKGYIYDGNKLGENMKVFESVFERGKGE